MKIKRRLKGLGRLALLLVPATVIIGALAYATPAASASTGTGWLRLAHLSPNTPPVDVYLYSFHDPNAMIVLHHVAYGTISGYETVPAGEYTVAMRGAGAASAVHDRQHPRRRRVHGRRHGPGERPAPSDPEGPTDDASREIAGAHHPRLAHRAQGHGDRRQEGAGQEHAVRDRHVLRRGPGGDVGGQGGRRDRARHGHDRPGRGYHPHDRAP